MIEFAYNYIIEQLQHNEFAIAGFLMTSISSFVYSLYVVPRLIWSAIRRNFSYSITLEEGQDLYNEFNRFLVENYKHRFRHTRPVFAYGSSNYTDGLPEGDDRILTDKEVRYDQDVDSFIFWFRGYPLLLSKHIEKLEGAHNIYNAKMGTYSISTLFNGKILETLTEELFKERCIRLEESRDVYVHTYNSSSGWQIQEEFKPITLKNVVSSRGVKDKLVNKVKTWQKNAPKLRRMGIKNKLGLLLYGANGNGKSSLGAAIAYELGYNVYYLDINALKSSGEYQHAMSTIEPNSALFLEDFDRVYDKDRNYVNPDCKVPFNTVLNSLSGVIEKDNILIIATTNKIEDLDPALKRSGRFDFVQEVYPPDFDSVQDYLSKFYMKDIYLDIHIKNMPVKFADLTNWCKDNIDNPEKVIEILQKENAKELVSC